MSWKKLQAAGDVKPHKTSLSEISDLRAVVARDLKDASLDGLSDDRRFATAYNAVLQLAKLVVACAGYRVSARKGHHRVTFEAVELAMGPAIAKHVAYFDACRVKRNTVDYDMANVTSESEADDLVKKAAEFDRLVEAWIAKEHPALRP